MKLGEGVRERICALLLEYDPGIVEIIQFGSSVYASELARDIDLLIFTQEEKDYWGYRDCLKRLDLDAEIDIVIKEAGEPLGGLALGVLGAGRIVYGDGSRMKESTKGVDPSFDEAWAALEEAREYMKSSQEVQDELRKDRRRRNAFNELAHAARTASLVYLAKERLGWEGIKDGLPAKYRREFQQYFEILHVQYFYEGNYPMEAEEEFAFWAEKVEGYVKRLEAEGEGK